MLGWLLRISLPPLRPMTYASPGREGRVWGVVQSQTRAGPCQSSQRVVESMEKAGGAGSRAELRISSPSTYRTNWT